MTEAATPARPRKALNARRSFWLKQLHQWHWISAAVSLIGLLLFAVTGITLNHAADIPAEPATVERTAVLPAPLTKRLTVFPEETTDPVPEAVARWAADALGVRIAGRPTETTADEIYVVPASNVEVTVARGGTRYRDNPEEMTLTAGADGAFTVAWPEPGLYWLNATVRTPAEGDTIAASAQYVAVMEVLP